MTEQAITARQFAEWVAACDKICQQEHGYSHELYRIEKLLSELGVPEPWREPVRVMTQGGYYYGADSWMKSAVGKTEQASTEAGK